MKNTRKPYVTEKKGRIYYRLTWTENGKRRERYLPLPGDEDSEEFDREYWSIRSGKSSQLKTIVRTSWEQLARHYRASHAYRKLKPGTRRKYDQVIEQLREKNGDKDIRHVSRAQIRAIHEKYAVTPRKADHYLQVIRLLLNFARLELEWIESNPAEGIKLFGPQTEFQPWPKSAQRAYVSACADLGEDIALSAFHLGTGTGQRPGDLCKMEWSHFDGEFIEVLQEKTGVRIQVFCPTALRDHLNGTPRSGRYILAKNLTQPLGYNALQKRFAKVRESAGAELAKLNMHGWRYTAAVALAEAGCSDAEIQAVTGHRTAAMAQKYRRQAQQSHLSKQAQNRRERNENKT